MEAAMQAVPLADIPLLERPYLDIADAYSLAGRPARARAIVAEFDRSGQAEQRRELAAQRQATLGGIALAEKRYADAIAAFRAADVGPCTVCMLPALGIAYDQSGNADSAVAVFERYLATPSGGHFHLDSWFLAGVHKRLGELYDRRRDAERAAQHYEHFVELWKDADPELRSQVDAARRRLLQLRPVEKVRAEAGS
ncbi:MAG: hypothetical protein M3336_18365 [Chloroflexota bacterium]|nr:hypothetical protein [Chloroflexota bacterium]